MDDDSRKNVVFIGVIALAVVILGYMLWSHTASPEPTLGPGQSIQNPFGNTDPKMGGKKAARDAGN